MTKASQGVRVVAAAAMIALTGCATRGGDIAYNPAGFRAPDALKAATVADDYKLGVGDVVTVRVFKVDSLSGDQLIDGTGRIGLPLVGAVQAAGLTTNALQASLQATLGAKYLQSPQVLVSIKSVVQKTVTVDGSIGQPGVYPVQNNATLLQTIAMARGPTEDANPRRIVVFRQIDGQRMAAAFDLVDIRRNKSPDPLIYPNDLIVVEGSSSSKLFKTVLAGLPFTAFLPR